MMQAWNESTKAVHLERHGWDITKESIARG